MAPTNLNLMNMTKDEIYNAPKYAGIYCFRNKMNGKCYIGQSIKAKKKIAASY